MTSGYGRAIRLVANQAPDVLAKCLEFVVGPRRVVAYWLLGLTVLVVLTLLGVKLPSETG